MGLRRLVVPDPFNFRIGCIAIVELGIFPVITMQYEPKMRKLAIPSIAILVLGAIGTFLSLLDGFNSLPTVAKAAANLALASLSYTYLAIFALVWGGIFKFLQRGGVALMKKDFIGTAKNLLLSALPLVIIIVISFCYQSYKSYRVFVSDPPRVQVSWKRETQGFELVPDGPTDINKEFLQSVHQYIVDVYATGPEIASAVEVAFQFPYAVEQASGSGNVFGQLSSGQPPIPILTEGPARLTGTNKSRNYVLSIPYMPPEGRFRLVFLLNTNSPGRGLCVGKCDVPLQTPTAPPIRGPMHEYIEIRTTFLYGERVGHTDFYAPFNVHSDKTVSAGDFGAPPEGLQRTYEP